MIKFRLPTVEVFATIYSDCEANRKQFRFPTVEVFATMETVDPLPDE